MIETNKLIICVAPCGGYIGKDFNPNIPVQPDEIAEEVVRSSNEGASIAYIHARDKDGKATRDPKILRETHHHLIRKKAAI